MFKKIKAMLVVLLLFIAMPLMAYASDNSSINNSNSTLGINDTGLSVNSTAQIQVNEDNKDSEIEVNSTENNSVEDNKSIVNSNETENENSSIESSHNNESSIENNGTENETEVENENETEVREVTDKDVSILSTGLGAQVRLLQLQRRIDVQVEGANIIISKLNQFNNTNQTIIDELNNITIQLQAISAQINQTDFNQNASVLAQEYVALKKQAIDLSKQFRDSVRGSLTVEQKATLKKIIDEREKIALEKKDARLDKFKLKYNELKIREILNRFGINDQQLLKKYQEGDLNISEIKNQLENKVNKLSPEQRKEIIQKAKEARAKLIIDAKEQRKDLIKKAQIRREELKKDFEQRFEEIKKNNELRREELKKNLENKFEDIKKREEQRREELKTRLEHRFENHTQVENSNRTRTQDNTNVTSENGG